LESATLQYADVNGESPITNFGSPLTITSIDLVYNEVISGNNSSGAVTLSAITNPPSTKCIAVVLPSEYAIPGTKGGILPTGTYPIVDMTYLLANADGNPSTQLAATQTLVNSPYNSSITSKVTTVGSGTGLALLTLGTGAFSSTAPGDCLTD
jgi:phosphate transport system substrate-binding protein